MTYLALKRSCKFKAAAVVAGLADAFEVIKKRPDLEDITFRVSIPNYSSNKDFALKQRSVIWWADEMCKSTPLLLMHGSGDNNVDAEQSMRLLQKLYEYKHPVRFILFEGADHFISQFEMEMLSQIKTHFHHYVRDGKLPPKL